MHVSRAFRKLSAVRRRPAGRPWTRLVPPVLGIAIAAAVTIPLVGGGGHPARRLNPVLARLPHAPVTSAAGPMTKPVTLVTGEQARFIPGPGGRSVVSVTPAKKSPGRLAFTPTDTFDVGGDVYAVPLTAAPYLGTLLDPHLFDVSYLQRAGYARLKTLPLSITWRSATHRAVPGIAAPATGLHTAGSVSAPAAADFAQALVASLPAASARAGAGGGQTRAAGALSQIQKITLGALPAGQPPAAGAAALTSSAAPAGTQLYTLTINALDRTGQPAYALIAVQNVDHFQSYYSVTTITPGQPLVLSVPAGQYGIEAITYDANAALGIMQNLAFVPVPQVTVASDTTVTLDARRAKPVTVTVPGTPTAPQIADLSFGRVSADGGAIGGAVFTYGPGASTVVPPVSFYAVPTPAPRIGVLGFTDSWELVPPGTGLTSPDIPYSYSLDFASSDGVPSQLSHTLTAGDLATVHESFPGPLSGDGFSTFATPFHAWSPLAVTLYPAWYTSPSGSTRTDYFGGSASTVWQQSAELFGPDTGQTPVAAPTGPYETFRPGEDIAVTWGGGPAVPAPPWQEMGVPGAVPSYVCPVCREGQEMSFNVFVADSDPAHSDPYYGFGSGVLSSTSGSATDSLKFYRNGSLVQVSDLSDQIFPLLPGTASYKIDWVRTIPATWTPFGATVDSSWTFTSGPARPDKLPGYELCAPDTTVVCSYLPLVFASYDFGANLQGQITAPGTETFTLTGYHEAGETGPPITSASVQVSFDDGTTWVPANLASLGNGQFRVSFAQPDPSATSGYASVRVSLSDAAGDALHQTIIRAYALTTAAAAGQPANPGQAS